jgi:hypothetical protein
MRCPRLLGLRSFRIAAVLSAAPFSHAWVILDLGGDRPPEAAEEEEEQVPGLDPVRRRA